MASLEWVRYCPNLRGLRASDNQITSMAPLASLKHLEWVNLKNNHIERIEGLEGNLSLQRLMLSDNHINRIEGLGGCNALTELGLNGNRIDRIEGLDDLLNLASLDVGSNKITRIEGLNRLHQLNRCNLIGNPAIAEELDAANNHPVVYCRVQRAVDVMIPVLSKELVQPGNMIERFLYDENTEGFGWIFNDQKDIPLKQDYCEYSSQINEVVKQAASIFGFTVKVNYQDGSHKYSWAGPPTFVITSNSSGDADGYVAFLRRVVPRLACKRLIDFFYLRNDAIILNETPPIVAENGLSSKEKKIRYFLAATFEANYNPYDTHDPWSTIRPYYVISNYSSGGVIQEFRADSPVDNRGQYHSPCAIIDDGSGEGCTYSPEKIAEFNDRARYEAQWNLLVANPLAWKKGKTVQTFTASC
nr:hypothetical protein [Candidatus Sigynarchaeota archaeon]